MAEKRLKRPRDIMQLAHLIGEIATQHLADNKDDGKDQKAIERGQKGGLKGGKARAKALTAKERVKIATNAIKERWKKAAPVKKRPKDKATKKD